MVEIESGLLCAWSYAQKVHKWCLSLLPVAMTESLRWIIYYKRKVHGGSQFWKSKSIAQDLLNFC